MSNFGHLTLLFCIKSVFLCQKVILIYLFFETNATLTLIKKWYVDFLILI